MDIRKVIITEIKRQGWTQRRLAAETGLTQSRIADYVRGARDMTGENLQRLLKALSLEITPTRRQK